MKKIFILLSLVSAGCTTTGSYIPINATFPQKESECSLKIIMPGQKFENKHTLIGTYSIQEMGLSVGCGWDDALNKNKRKACAVGADVIKFIEVNTPSIRSTCYTTKANFLKIEN